MWMQNLRLAFRTLRRSPGFTATAILILGIGIGGIAGSFAIVDSFLLRPLPFEDPSRLVHLYRTDPQSGNSELRFALPMIAAMRDGTDSLADLGAYEYGGRNLAGGAEEPQHLMVSTLTTNVLDVLGSRPVLGRGFTAQDGLEGAAPVVLLDHGLWRTRFGSSNDVLGSRVDLDGEPHTIIGVMPESFSFPYGEVKLWVPTDLRSASASWTYRNYQPVGRLAPGVEREALREEMQTLYRETARQQTGTVPDYGVAAVPLRKALLFLYDLIQIVVLLILVANAFVLLIICANVANLMIGRAVGRGREMALRSVLGAERSQLVRQVLSEGLLLAAGGSIVGLAFAGWQAASADRMLPEALFRAGPIALNPRILSFTILVSALAVLAFALTPALQASRVDLVRHLRVGPASSGARSSHRARSTMVVVQVCSAFVLLLATALLIKSVDGMQEVDLGFDPDHVLTMGVHLNEKSYPEPRDVSAFQNAVVASVEQIPGVESAAFVEPLPMNFATTGRLFEVEGREPTSAQERLQARAHWVSERYFETLDMAILGGRTFDLRDDLESPEVVVVNEAFSRLYWDADPVGKRLRFGSDADWATVVGLVGDSKNFFLNEDNVPILYLAQAQRPLRSAALTVRTSGDPIAAFPAVRDRVWSVHPALPLSEVRSMEDVVGASMLPWKGASAALVALGLFAVVLAGLGVFAVASESVSSRISEIGVRRALGASSADVLRTVVRQGGRLVAIGLVVGLVLSAALNRLLGSLLFGIGSLDLVSHVAVLAALLAAAALAMALPAWRAARVDPMVALRDE